ncbi:hypothetical protein P7H17_20535 [Paenibacillus larvae]|nr:hypothetical protein [Paenibacillus larvae]MDT2287963.1 hypothetical protein [Paenibacillus larvae]
MKILSKALLSSIAAFGLLAGSVSTQTPGQQAITSQQAGVKSTIVNPLIKLKVGWSTWIGMPGSKVVLVSGEGVVSLDQYGKVVGLTPVMLPYIIMLNGNLYINHIQVTY